MSKYNNVQLKYMHYNGHKVKKWIHNGICVYNSGNVVTYHVDNGISYTEEVESDSSCLSPTTFIPTKSGWTFVGWKTDTTANGSILTNMFMGDNPVTLYAVFVQTVTLSYSGNGATSGSVTSQTGTRYYNSGNYSNPTFTLSANGFAYGGRTFKNWAKGSAGGTQYAAGTSLTLTESTIFYAVWKVDNTIITPVTDVVVFNGSGYESTSNIPYLYRNIDTGLYKAITFSLYYTELKALMYNSNIGLFVYGGNTKMQLAYSTTSVQNSNIISTDSPKNGVEVTIIFTQTSGLTDISYGLEKLSDGSNNMASFRIIYPSNATLIGR